MKKKVKRYWKLYCLMISKFFQGIMQSKVDFFTGLVGFFLTQIMGIAFLQLVFSKIPTLQGWTLDQLIFIYGFVQIPRGLDHLFTDNIWMIAWKIVINGDFDRYMIRPMNLFFQVISEKLQPDAVGELLIGTILVVRSIQRGVIIVDLAHILLFIISVVAGAFIYTAIKLFYASLAFWIKISGPFLQVVYEMSDFAKYPSEIYTKGIRFIITWIIPFALVAYLPACCFISTKSSGAWIIGVECIVAAVFCFISYQVFKRGTDIYESAGN